MKKTIFFALSALLLICSQGYAQQADRLSKDNSIALKIGGHVYPDSDFMDFWRADAADYNGLAFELSYERMLTPNLGIEIPVGYNSSKSTYSNVFSAGDNSKVDIDNLYISPSLKLHIPLNRVFEAYIGGGIDFYHTWVDFDYSDTSPAVFNESETANTLGYHGLAGIDWFFDNSNTSFPVSIFVEYKYTSLTVDNADDKVLDAMGSSASKHDLDVGGSSFFTGMRWHY
ncbi:MAG: outer membrane beta-barrel protein [Thermodesulfovibrionia bacterium]|nr:outer membrane beta-barrel protein [Thermodesulfovibrionia bacterium]